VRCSRVRKNSYTPHLGVVAECAPCIFPLRYLVSHAVAGLLSALGDCELRTAPAPNATCPAVEEGAGWLAVQRAHHGFGRHRPPARLQARLGRHRLEAAGVALRLRPLARLAQIQEPRCARGEAGVRGRLGKAAATVTRPSSAHAGHHCPGGFVGGPLGCDHRGPLEHVPSVGSGQVIERTTVIIG